MTKPALDTARLLLGGDLPPKPPAPEGRAVLWVWVLGEPGLVYGGAEYPVDAAEIDRQVAAFDLMTHRGYSPPLAIQHPEQIHAQSALSALRDLPPGLRAGDVLALRRWTVGGRQALIAAVCPAMPAADVERAVELGQLKYFSAGLGPVETDQGDVLRLVLKELSIVPAPHHKTAASHVLAAEQEVPMEPEVEVEVEKPDLAAMVAECMKRLEAMEAKMAEMTPKADAPEGEMTASERKVAAMELEIVALKERAFVAPLPAEVTIKVGREVLGELHRKDAALAAKLVKAQVTLSQPAAPPIGNEGAPAPAPRTPEELAALCLQEAGGDKVKANALYLERRRKELSNG